MPLATLLSGANRHDVTQLIPLVDAIPPVRGLPGAPLRKPGRVTGDRAYDSQRRNTPHGSRMGVFRWFVEQTLSLMHQFKRLRVRDDRDDQVHEAFMTLACAIICWRRLRHR